MSENGSDSRSPGKRKLSTEENKTNVEEPHKRRKSEDTEPSTSANIVVKTENVAEETTRSEESINNVPVIIKSEPVEERESPVIDSSSIPEPSTSSNVSSVAIKTEPTNDTAAVVVRPDPANTSRQSPAPDSSVSSSTLRPSCRFGIRCYRRNPAHRRSEAHPGDSDYRRPSFPAPPLGTPSCAFGNSCYRRNPIHFQEYSHPPDFNSDQNIRNRLRHRRAQAQNSNAGIGQFSDFESDEEDPFYDDAGSDLDYRPGAQLDDDDEEEDDLEFNSERQNCDEFD